MKPTACKRSPSSGFDWSTARKEIEAAKARGLIRASLEPVPVAKNGVEATAQGALRSQWIEVSPAMARDWLHNNFRNRPLKDDVVEAYARDMANGVWVPTHQGIAFNDQDELIDGQHRLHAIVRSGKTVRTMVTFGLPGRIEGHEMTTMDAVDRGRTRSVADQLKIQHGLKDGSVIAALCACLASLCCGDRTRRLSVGETLEIYRAFEAALSWVIANRPREHGLRSAGCLAGFVFAMTAAPACDRSTIEAMFTELTHPSGARPGTFSHMARLRGFLTSDEARLLSRGTNRGLAELTLETIRRQLCGSRVTKLEVCETGAEHFRALQRKRVEAIRQIFRLDSIPQAG
jgi:hypothetical protein